MRVRSVADATRLRAWLRSGDGIGWLAAGIIPNSLYRVPFFYLFLAGAFCYYCSFKVLSSFLFCFVILFFCLLPLDLCRCFSVFFLSSRPRTGYLGGHTTDYSCELSGTAASAEPKVPKRGSYHSTTPTSVRGTHGQTTRRAPPEAADGRKTSRGGRSRQGTPGAELDGLSQGRLPSVRSHRRLYDEQPAHIRS